MSDHVFRFLVTPNLVVEPKPKQRLWKMARDCYIAIKVQRLNDDEQTRLAIRGTFAQCREFAANLEHCSTRAPIWFLVVTEVLFCSNPESDYQKHFHVDRFDEFDDRLVQIFPTPYNSRPGSSGGASAPRQPSVFDTDSAGSASASTIRRQLEIAQEAVDEANDTASASAMEAARLRNEAAAAAGREAAERRAREAAEAQAAQDVAARQAAEAQAAEALAEVVRLRALLGARS